MGITFIAIGIVLIGLILGLFGLRFTKIIIALSGFIVGFSIAWLVISNFGITGDLTVQLILLVVALLAGIFTAAIFTFLIDVAIILNIGFITFFMLSVLGGVLSLPSQTILAVAIIGTIFVCIIAIVFQLYNVLIAVVTSINGSILVTYGVFVILGFINLQVTSIQNLFTGKFAQQIISGLSGNVGVGFIIVAGVLAFLFWQAQNNFLNEAA